MRREAQAIRRMEISDSRLAEVMRPVMLTFAGDDEADEPVAHVAPNGVIREALFAAAKAAGVNFVASAISRAEMSGARAVAELADGSALSAPLLVAAEGANSPLRKLAKIKTQGWRYDQTAIVTTIALEHAHDGIAVQHFLEGGPFALLPLPGKRASVVWAERRLQAERLYALDDTGFRAALQERAGYRFGEIALDGPRAMRPLSLQVAKSFVGNRLALIGDAAHVTHPIAGQGLNIGLRDVAALAEAVADAARLGGDIGAPHVLDRYERWRRFDTMLMLAAMDGLLKLFSLRSSLRAARARCGHGRLRPDAGAEGHGHALGGGAFGRCSETAAGRSDCRYLFTSPEPSRVTRLGHSRAELGNTRVQAGEVERAKRAGRGESRKLSIALSPLVCREFGSLP